MEGALGSSDEHESGGLPVALVDHLEPAMLAFGDGPRLACVYAQLDPGSAGMGEFLDGVHDCDDVTGWAWSARRADRSAAVSIDLLHGCGAGPGLQLRIERSGFPALEWLTQRPVLVVADGPWVALEHQPPSTLRLAAYGVDPAMVRRVLDAANAGLRRLASVN